MFNANEPTESKPISITLNNDAKGYTEDIIFNPRVFTVENYKSEQVKVIHTGKNTCSVV